MTTKDKPSEAIPRTFVIACGVLALDIPHVADELGLEIGTQFLEGGLHDRPGKLRETLQTAINESSASGQWDRIAIGYGICGRGLVGIKAGSIPLIVPRVHDCIALFMGGNNAYRNQFKQYPGTYYISAGWYEEKTEPLTQKRPYAFMGDKRVYYDELVAEYGEEQARETMSFLNSWKRNYQRAAFIDTGVSDNAKYAQYAREMAENHGWRYDEIPGDLGLIERLLRADQSKGDILVVPPEQVTVFDAATARLQARPKAAADQKRSGKSARVHRIKGQTPLDAPTVKVGLGIDAGGTYTDAVSYDFGSRRVRAKHKGLTTPWNYTIGIETALSGLDQTVLAQTELVAVSTTLATNAIVEGVGQRVGLLLMPPYGQFKREDIPHEPKAVIAGRLEISGRVTGDIDPDQIRRIGHQMVDQMGVKAFAVSGFAGAINPEHELRVKEILAAETGCFVSCGHELSDLLNFRTRAETAVLNARIVPRLVRLLADLDQVLVKMKIQAPVMVVKGDGSLMSREMAMQRPVETILSGPAASVAGARFLTRLENAIVVDMGGTTTDTAAISDGRVKIVDSGSQVGGRQTHVKALEIRTSGLGGDSQIAYANGQFKIGPRRVAPIAWLGSQDPNIARALNYLRDQPASYAGTSEGMQILTCTDRTAKTELTDIEAKIVTVLSQRPHALGGLATRVGAVHPSTLPLARLENDHIVQRCGFTPTDLLHVNGTFVRWETSASRQICELYATLSGREPEAMVSELMTATVKQLALELIQKQVGTIAMTDDDEGCSVCQALFDNLFHGGNDDFKLRYHLKRPIVGIGAPIAHFLPAAARFLEAEVKMPQDADVANAIGAISSQIVVQRLAKVRPARQGGFVVEGIAGAERFAAIESAEAYARNVLVRLVQDIARAAGTSQSTVVVKTEDKITRTAQGDEIFLERTISADLTGPPDLPLAARSQGPDQDRRAATQS